MRRLLTALFLLGLVTTACGDDNPATSPTVSPIFIGRDTVIPPIGTQEAKPATNDYPFSRWVTLPPGTQQLSVFQGPGSTTWVATFVLPSSSFAAVEALRREAEAKGLKTINIATGGGGFSLHGDIEGIVQVQSFDATSQTIFIALTKLPQ